MCLFYLYCNTTPLQSFNRSEQQCRCIAVYLQCCSCTEGADNFTHFKKVKIVLKVLFYSKNKIFLGRPVADRSGYKDRLGLSNV